MSIAAELARTEERIAHAEEAMLNAAGMTAGPAAASVWAAAQSQMEQATAAAERLRSLAAAEADRERRWDAAVSDAAPLLERAAAGLADAQAAATAAVAAAQKAAAAATAALIRYNTAVAQAERAMTESGFRAPRDGERPGTCCGPGWVQLFGVLHATVDPAGGLAWLAHRVAVAALTGRQRDLFRYDAGRVQVARMTCGPLVAVPEPKAPR